MALVSNTTTVDVSGVAGGLHMNPSTCNKADRVRGREPP